MSHLLQSAGPGTSLIYTAIGDLSVEMGDLSVETGDFRWISWRAVAVAFFSGDFQLGLEYRSDETLCIKGEEGDVERNH